MSLVRARCGVSTQDFPFFFDSGHHELAEHVRHLGLRALGPEEERHAAAPPADHATLAARCRAIAKQLAASRVLEVCVPAAHGGMSLGRPETVDVRAICLVRETLAWASGLAEFVFAMQGLGTYPIVLAGTDAQRREFLPGVIDGSSIAAFAITEPDAGSDVAAMRATARRDGSGGYVLDGTKTFISNAGIAGHYVVFAKTSPDAGSKGVSAFVVRPTDPGFVFERPLSLMADHPIGTIRFDGLKVPASRRLGTEGDGFRIAMATLDVFRGTVGAAACGMARRALDDALQRVTERSQFGQAIAEFQTTKAYLAEMATELDAARLLVYRAAFARDAGSERVTLEASMAKMFATEAAQRIVDRALQLHGGLGVVRGTSVERLYREVRALRIYEGTTEIQRLVIAGVLLGGERARANEARALAAELAASRTSDPGSGRASDPGGRTSDVPTQPRARATTSSPAVTEGGADETRKVRSLRPPDGGTK